MSNAELMVNQLLTTQLSFFNRVILKIFVSSTLKYGYKPWALNPEEKD